MRSQESALQMEIGDARILVPRTVERGSVVHVRALLSHPMDTGFFRTSEGKPIPAYFVKEVIVAYGDETVARFQWTSGISRDPFVAFPLKATREAPLTITWKDNRGGEFRQTAEIRFA
jgi:sulfur-oxidizing protein SoxZ